MTSALCLFNGSSPRLITQRNQGNLHMHSHEWEDGNEITQFSMSRLQPRYLNATIVRLVSRLVLTNLIFYHKLMNMFYYIYIHNKRINLHFSETFCDALTHWSRVTHACVGNLCHNWFSYWLVAFSAPNHYLNQCCIIVNSTIREKFRWHPNRNLNIFIQENVFEKVVCDIATILTWPQCVHLDTSIPTLKWSVLRLSPSYRDMSPIQSWNDGNPKWGRGDCGHCVRGPWFNWAARQHKLRDLCTAVHSVPVFRFKK